jgi:hypothetical protein
MTPKGRLITVKKTLDLYAELENAFRVTLLINLFLQVALFSSDRRDQLIPLWKRGARRDFPNCLLMKSPKKFPLAPPFCKGELVPLALNPISPTCFGQE